ncbi:MAG: ABC transporter permease [Gammaproteobacteria bacterium]|nr:ABC transporter permease [Gammaproteobacteria bacterium]MDD9823652.1 ABC transporter permease [Gammaproteobacteria bacterium]MDD9864050.1 ABC transporter permease [Gammaproteobacteria bacterium]
MLRYLYSRLAGALLVVIGVTAVVFALSRVIPGDPVEIMAGESATPMERQAMAEAMGLDRPLLAQWWLYLRRLAVLDLGASLHSGRRVSDLLADSIPATLLLAAATLAFAALLSLALGVLAALKRGSAWDRGATACALLGLSLPNFWLGPLLILVFAYRLGWFPVGGMGGPGALVLPALTLGTAMVALQMRMVRGSLIDVLETDYVRAARARGLPPWRVVLGHALSNALLPAITIVGLHTGALLTGAVVTEHIFSWPGVGQLMFEAIRSRDYPVIQGCVLLIGTVYVGINLLTDLVYCALDPRIRLEAEERP